MIHVTDEQLKDYTRFIEGAVQRWLDDGPVEEGYRSLYLDREEYEYRIGDYVITGTCEIDVGWDYKEDCQVATIYWTDGVVLCEEDEDGFFYDVESDISPQRLQAMDECESRWCYEIRQKK